MNLPQLLDNLNSRDASLREDAERRLRALAPDELTAFIRLEQTYFERWARRQWIKITPGWIMWMTLLLALMELFERIHWHVSGGFGVLFLAGLGGIYSYFRLHHHPHSRYALVVAISELDNTRYLPTILTMLTGAGAGGARYLPTILTKLNGGRVGGETKYALDAALLRLLPQLRPGDADRWTSAQWAVLTQLTYYPLVDVEITLAVLRALQQIGDQRFTQRVLQLASIRTKYSFATRPQYVSVQDANVRSVLVKQAAQECLPFIAQRQQKVDPHQTLLRASAPVTPTDTLLRPAMPVVQENGGQQLLRPAADKRPRTLTVPPRPDL